MRLVTVDEMKKIEAEANASGFSYAAMMANAGHGLAEAIIKAYSHPNNRTVLGLVGAGNNGGDTLIALARLAHKGWQVTAYLATSRDPEEVLLKQFRDEGGRIIYHQDETAILMLDKEISQARIILDGILGTGFKHPLRRDTAHLLKHIHSLVDTRQTKPHIVAVDCPSGLDCDSGQASEECLKAEMTVCMAAVKAGLMNPEAANLCGRLVVIDIGINPDLSAWKAADDRILEGDLVRSLLPDRPESAHKGTFGTVLIATGSMNYPGAVLLAATSAYRIGAGLVTAAVPEPLLPILAGHLPECTWIPLPDTGGALNAEGVARVISSMNKATAILIGPGMGTSDTALDFLKIFLGIDSGRTPDPTPTASKQKEFPPLIIDADGLRLLAKIPEWPSCLSEGNLITPHPGEMSALTGLSITEIQNNRMQIAREYAIKWKQVVILKGAFTVIASPQGRVSVNALATSALAHAGTGDVLAGMAAGLLAQGLDAEKAGSAAVYLHGRAALAALEMSGSPASVLAGDVANSIGAAIKELGN